MSSVLFLVLICSEEELQGWKNGINMQLLQIIRELGGIYKKIIENGKYGSKSEIKINIGWTSKIREALVERLLLN